MNFVFERETDQRGTAKLSVWFVDIARQKAYIHQYNDVPIPYSSARHALFKVHFMDEVLIEPGYFWYKKPIVIAMLKNRMEKRLLSAFEALRTGFLKIQ